MPAQPSQDNGATGRGVAETRGSRRRHEIVRHAALLFQSRGFHATSMDEIAEAVGLRKPSLYHYFGSKDEILHEIHDEFIEILISQHQDRLLTGSDVKSLLLELMVDIIELMESHPGYVQTFFESLRDLSDEPREAILARRVVYQHLVVDLFKRGVEEGVLKQMPPQLATQALFGMCTWAYHWYRTDGEFRPREIAFFFWNSLMFGMAAPTD